MKLLNFFLTAFFMIVHTKASIHGTYNEALNAVNRMKDSWGHGVSAKLIFWNNTPDTLRYTDSDHFSGRWENPPPQEIPPGKYAAFFHVKRSGSWAGSIGFATYQNPRNEKIFIGWYCPHSGSNYVGVEAIEPGTYIEDTYALTYQTVDRRTSNPFGVSISGTASLVENNDSILAFYTCNPSNH